MEVDLLKTFQRVAVLGSISKTADDLYLSVSTVTGRIKSLEEELGKELFLRTGRRIELTSDGEKFLQYVNRFISLLHEGQSKVKQAKDTYIGELSIAVTPIIASYLLPKLIRQFRFKYPQIHLRITACPNFQAIDKVSNGQVELGIVHHVLDEGGLVAKSWFHDEVLLIMPADHPLSVYQELQPNDLRGFPIIGYSNHPHWEALQQWFRAAKLNPSIMMEFGHMETLKKCIQEFQAISFLPRISVDEELRQGLFRSVNTSPAFQMTWDFEFISRQNLQLSKPAVSFIDFATRGYPRPRLR